MTTGRFYYKTFLSFVFLIVCVSGFVSAQENHNEREHRYRPEQFEQPARAEWQKVGEVIQAIGLDTGDRIADIGGATGFFSRPFARRVGPTGVVYCCDLATNLLEFLQETARKEGLNNIVTVYAAMDRPMLPPSSVDFLFFCNTNHHLSDRVEYYRNLKPLLRPGGQVIVVDWKKIRQKVGPRPGHTVAKSVVIEEMESAGWKLFREETFLDYQYFLVFEPVWDEE